MFIAFCLENLRRGLEERKSTSRVQGQVQFRSSKPRNVF